MMHGLGCDILEIDRIKEAIDRHGQSFLDKIFTKEEQIYCLQQKESAIRFAGRFAAKEAIAKALKTGFGKELSFTDIEILNDEKGAPIATFLSDSLRSKRYMIHLSISHSKTHAMAVASLEVHSCKN